MVRFATALLLLAATQPAKPHLAVRSSPRVALANIAIGCAPVLLFAEIKGPEDETWYCPKVSWEWPDGTTSVAESDCPPFEARHACMEPQEGCGNRGWRRNPITDEIVDDVKECPCTIVGYPRLWSRNVCMPPHPEGQAWIIGIRLSKDGRTIARENVNVIVR